MPLLFCTECGAYASKASKLLPQPCGASRTPVSIQVAQLSRLRRGLHPQAKKGHIEGMRQVSIPEAYNILRPAITQDRGGSRPDYQL
eukprot:4229909-Amphidinium_carterae.1